MFWRKKEEDILEPASALLEMDEIVTLNNPHDPLIEDSFNDTGGPDLKIPTINFLEKLYHRFLSILFK